MKAKAIFHTGITVSDLDRTASFLKEWFGMVARQVVWRQERRPWDNPVTGIKKTRPTLLPEAGRGHRRALAVPVAAGAAPVLHRPQRVGNAHLAFFVDDLDAYYERLTAQGYRFAGPIHYNVDAEGKRRAGIFFWDHDGISYELVYREAESP